ncbi:hypothetical protein CHARACLAT_010330 [Characodon lateralis]|uniref:Uncharacterized protein n=1 Tax=Characodon lateralis TaxID=208331 RepID=A0ABU7DFC2_9TELE|nr:hypothetical protein [Characodon lateralis]
MERMAEKKSMNEVKRNFANPNCSETLMTDVLVQWFGIAVWHFHMRFFHQVAPMLAQNNENSTKKKEKEEMC